MEDNKKKVTKNKTEGVNKKKTESKKIEKSGAKKKSEGKEIKDRKSAGRKGFS